MMQIGKIGIVFVSMYSMAGYQSCTINREHLLKAHDYLRILTQLERNLHYHRDINYIFNNRSVWLHLKTQEWCNVCSNESKNKNDFYACLTKKEKNILGKKDPLFRYCAAVVLVFALLETQN